MRILLAVLFLLPAPTLAASLVFTEDLRIETAGTDQEFGQIGSIAIAADGTLYVADSGFGVIHAFDQLGEFLRSFGRVGEGPGDLPNHVIMLAIDGSDNLLVAGTRSSIARLDPNGDLLGSIPLDTIINPRSLFCLPDERIGFTSSMRWGGQRDGAPPMLHIVDGDSLISTGRSEWWDDSLNSPLSSGLISATAAVDPVTGEVVFLQAQPFDLRRYRSDGTLIHRSTNGFVDFVTAPNLPEINGDTMVFSFAGGSAGSVLVAPDRNICVRAFRMHPSDVEVDRDEHPEFEPRWQYAIALFRPDFSVVAEVRGESLPAIRCFDAEGRLWASDRDDDGVPFLARYRMEVVD